MTNNPVGKGFGVNDQQIFDALRELKQDVLERIEASDRITAANHRTLAAQLKGIDHKVAQTNGQVAKHVTAIHQSELKAMTLEAKVESLARHQTRQQDFALGLLKEHLLEYHPAESMPGTPGDPSRKKRNVPVWGKMSPTQQATVKVTAVMQAVAATLLTLLQSEQFRQWWQELFK